MAQTKLPPLPVILLANDLLDGDVVFKTAFGWSRDPSEALIAQHEDVAFRLQEAGQAAMARNEVVDAYLVDVAIEDGGLPLPRHFRERFKVLGPSIRPDLGKQAEFLRNAPAHPLG